MQHQSTRMWQAAIAKHSREQDGSLVFCEFLQLVCTAPWWALLPEPTRTQVRYVAEPMAEASDFVAKLQAGE